jgi:heme-binding NEAT domain protein
MRNRAQKASHDTVFQWQERGAHRIANDDDDDDDDNDGTTTTTTGKQTSRRRTETKEPAEKPINTTKSGSWRTDFFVLEKKHR